MAGAGLRQGILLNSMPGTSSCRTSCFFTLLITFRLVKHFKGVEVYIPFGLRSYLCYQRDQDQSACKPVPIYRLLLPIYKSLYIGNQSQQVSPHIEDTSPSYLPVPIHKLLFPIHAIPSPVTSVPIWLLVLRYISPHVHQCIFIFFICSLTSEQIKKSPGDTAVQETSGLQECPTVADGCCQIIGNFLLSP